MAAMFQCVELAVESLNEVQHQPQSRLPEERRKRKQSLHDDGSRERCTNPRLHVLLIPKK